jgi:hypothetical protein
MKETFTVLILFSIIACLPVLLMIFTGEEINPLFSIPAVLLFISMSIAAYCFFRKDK